MTWVRVDAWSPEVVERLDAFHDINGGVVVTSATPGCKSERTALLTILGGLGKDATTYGVPNDAPSTRRVLNAWVRGEAVHTVVLLGAQRWRIGELRLAADQLESATCQLIPVTMGSVGPELSSALDLRFGDRKRPDELSFRYGRLPATSSPEPLDAELEPLRSYRLPYIAAVAACLLAGISGEHAVSLPITAHDGHQDALTTTDGVIALPRGTGRFLHAQRTLSEVEGSPLLLSRFGRPLSCADVAMASIRSLGDYGISLTPPSAAHN